MELTYIRVGDYYIPNLVADEPEPVRTVGKYGSLRRTYLKQHKHDLWRELAGSGRLTAHLLDIDDTAQEWMDRMLPQMMEAAGVTEELKARDQLAWVHAVALSFPYSSLLCGNPCMMFEVYSDFPFFAPKLVQEIFSAPWVFPDWTEFYEDLLTRTQKLGLGTVIRPPYIKSSMWDVARYILHFASTFVKTKMVDVEQLSSFKAMRKAEVFRVTFGEYMDWQRLIYAQLPPIDIFNCEEHETLTFRRFSSAVYENKAFDNLQLDDARFESCVFRNCSFKDSKLRDAKFEGCDFEDCRFEQVRLDGARFSGSKLLNVDTNL